MTAERSHAGAKLSRGASPHLLVGSLGILLALLIIPVVAGCGSSDNEPAATTTEAAVYSVAEYKSDMAAILTDLQTATETAGAALEGAAAQPATDSAAKQAQAEQVQQAATQWATAVSSVETALGALTPPDEAASFHSDYVGLVGELKALIEKLADTAGYTGGVITAYMPLETAGAEGGTFAQMQALVVDSPEAMEELAGLAADTEAILQALATEWESLSPPTDSVEIHATTAADLGTAVQTAGQLVASANGLVESDTQEGRDEYTTLAEQFGVQWANVEQDKATWETVHDTAESQWSQELDGLGTRLDQLAAAFDAL
jgi:hypothetical protein